jgi:hypothetical protein
MKTVRVRDAGRAPRQGAFGIELERSRRAAEIETGIEARWRPGAV